MYRVLIVDDQRREAWNMRAGIESLAPEFRVHNVMSGEEALLEARLQPFDLLISEVRLPGITGLELVSKLRDTNPDLKAILLVGAINAALKEEAVQLNIEALIEKPLEIADVLDAVERALGLTGEDANPLQAQTQEEAASQSVSDRLADLRQQIDAFAVVMLNDHGQVLVQAGDWPAPGIESAIPPLMSTFSASQKISRYLNMTSPKNLFLFSGAKYDMVMSPVGEAYALLIVAPPESVTHRVADLNRHVADGVKDLLDILSNMGVPLHIHTTLEAIPAPTTAQEEKPPLEEDARLDEDFEKLFTKAAQEAEKIDLDSFWEPSEEDSSVLTSRDALSYEQALRLGLAPDDE